MLRSLRKFCQCQSDSREMAMKEVLVFGSTGALGSEIVSILSKGAYKVTGVAFRASPGASDTIIITRGTSLAAQFAA
jgi:dTDP-4-dehydrorhamnose reductase